MTVSCKPYAAPASPAAAAVAQCKSPDTANPAAAACSANAAAVVAQAETEAAAAAAPTAAVAAPADGPCRSKVSVETCQGVMVTVSVAVNSTAAAAAAVIAASEGRNQPAAEVAHTPAESAEAGATQHLVQKHTWSVQDVSHVQLPQNSIAESVRKPPSHAQLAIKMVHKSAACTPAWVTKDKQGHILIHNTA